MESLILQNLLEQDSGYLRLPHTILGVETTKKEDTRQQKGALT